MNIFQRHLDDLKTGLSAALPSVIVNRSLIDYANLRREELMQGVVTILLEKVKPSDDWTSMLQVLITGQVEVAQASDKDQTGEIVEAAELALFGHVRAFLRNTGGLPNITPQDVQFSAQSKVPFGWFLLRAEYGPIGEACMDWDFGDGDVPDGMYPPNVVITDLNGVGAMIDVAPHDSAEEHEKWLVGDFSTSVPDADLTVELKNGTKDAETP